MLALFLSLSLAAAAAAAATAGKDTETQSHLSQRLTPSLKLYTHTYHYVNEIKSREINTFFLY